jgi:RNA polymerase sigma-70 factor (ECF subfamily)
MEQQPRRDVLNQISTLWSVLQQAHEGESEQAQAACQELWSRYGGAVYRYLLGALRDPEAANDLAQEFALRFVRGAFRRADVRRGRFRDYLKAALSNVITDYRNQRKHWPQPLSPEGGPEPVAQAESSADSDLALLASWREQLLESTWTALVRAHPRYHAVLRLRVDQPDLSSAQAAAQLTVQWGEPCNAAWVRKALQRAHDKYADLLLEEVAQSLPTVTAEALRQELRDLDLLKYCQAALERWPR